MTTRELLILLLIFIVTLGDHSAVPNLYVFWMVLAQGKDLHPYAIFASAALSITLYEHTLYWLGRIMRTHPIRRKYRLVRVITEGGEVVARLLEQHTTLWLIFGRFLAFVGLYIPFAWGQMHKSYFAFCVWGTFGMLFHLSVFGIPAYLLGDLFEQVIERTPIGLISLGVMFLFSLTVFWRYRRKKRRKVSHPAP